MYKVFSQFYDNFTNDMNRDDAIMFLEKCFIKFGNQGLKKVVSNLKTDSFLDNGISIEDSSLVIDVGCGTGVLTSMMADKGYDMTGLDVSLDMLDIAKEREEKNNKDNRILWLCQDMSKMDTFGSYAAMYCLEDGVNHLIRKNEFESFIKRSYNFVDPNGLLIFDFLTDTYFEKIGEEGIFFDDEDKRTCIWTANYNKSKRIIHYDVICYEKVDNEKYERYEDEVDEHSRNICEVREILEKYNYKILGFYKDFEMHKAKETDGRVYVVARKILK